MCFAFLASGDCEQPPKARMSARLTPIMLIVWRAPIAEPPANPRVLRPCTMPQSGVLGNATEVGGLKRKQDARTRYTGPLREPSRLRLFFAHHYHKM